ncbi:exopolysaccharide biosynthesis protein [Sphingomonas sp. ac-8]|uniref:exopolysaccharide biosynthesis protein n=1 Tax=Sphingomonas sp. ac-8 TaxID=3242977 RepID=UPI003A807C83
MNSAPPPPRRRNSLLERAVERYGFQPGVGLRPGGSSPVSAPMAVAPEVAPVPARAPEPIDRVRLAERGMLVPGGAVSTLAEEFRLVKRQLLAARGAGGRPLSVLVCSAHPDEGKTFCAVNLSLSLAAERDWEVLLVDADFAKPDVPDTLGLPAGPGLLDALADPSVDLESCIIPTDVPHLSVLPAGTRSDSDTELLASERARALLDRLEQAQPRRLMLFDSAPVLAASTASALAEHVGQVLMVVRADRTGESDLREAVALLDGCETVQLLLNAVSLQPRGHRFGSYYEAEEEA